MLTKTQLKEVFLKYDFHPLKRLGENYLIDGNIKDKIIGEARLNNVEDKSVGQARPEKGNTVLEIGPGLGALTIDLAKTGANIFAVEKDKKAFNILKDIAGGDFPNLKIFNEDILEFDFKKIASSEKIRVIGNLPYYITTPIIEQLIGHKDMISAAVIMVQKEVASRLMAEAGSKDYGSFSCFINYYTKPSYIYTVKRTCFYPPPEVDSAIMRLDVRGKPSVDVKDERLFFRIVRGAFNQRRKSIINSLSREAVLGFSKEKLSNILTSIGIDPAVRPENLNLQDFAKIANEVI